MKMNQFTESQIFSILKEFDAGKNIQELARAHGVSKGTIYNWKANYVWTKTSQPKLNLFWQNAVSCHDLFLSLVFSSTRNLIASSIVSKFLMSLLNSKLYPFKIHFLTPLTPITACLSIKWR